MHIFPLIYGGICSSRLFLCELHSFGDIGYRYVYLLLNIMQLGGAQSSMSLSRNHDSVTQDNPQTL